jgi:hypothetical protein
MQTGAKWSWVLPATGIVAVALIVAVFAIAGEGPDATKKTAQEVAKFYEDNDTQQTVAAFLTVPAAVAFLFFGGFWRRVLRDAEGPGGSLSTVAFGGSIVAAASFAIVGTLVLALTDLADDIAPTATQAINGIVWDYYTPFLVGMSAFALASGIAVVRTGVVPLWLGWIAVVLGIAALTPFGFFAMLGTLAWILIVSGLLIARSRGAAPATPAAPSVPA